MPVYLVVDMIAKVSFITSKQTVFVMATIAQINTALSRYYQLWNVPYSDQFSTFCEDNGFDDEIIHDEFESEDNYDENALIEFDQDFPYNTHLYSESTKSTLIHKILHRCYNHPDDDMTDFKPPSWVEFYRCMSL